MRSFQVYRVQNIITSLHFNTTYYSAEVLVKTIDTFCIYATFLQGIHIRSQPR